MSAVDTASAPTAPSRPLEGPAERRRRQRIAVIFGIAALLLLWMRIETAPGDVVFAPTSPFDEKQLSEIHLPAALTVTICLVVAVVGTVLQAFGLLHGAVRGLVVALVSVAFMVGFLCWVYSGQDLPMTNPLPGTMKYATPLILGALAGALCERSGVINVAIEGQFLAGAFIASVIGTMTYSPYLGMLGGIGAGVLIAALLAVFAIRYLVNQVILGVVLVVLAGGITGFLLDQIPDSKTLDLNSPPILQPVSIPGLAAIPVIGPAFFQQTWLVYIMYVSVALVTFILFETRWGLRVRAVGEHPTAADTVGINVKRTRYQAVLFGGVFAGLGGAYFTIGSTGAFDKEASGGTGFIALAALIMGRWHPVGATLAALFFGFASQLQNQLQILQKIPSELLGMTPYIATVIAVAGFVGRVRAPAADGEPYVKG
jgi:general nucleoside transport system permease protein